MDFCDNPYIRPYMELGDGTKHWFRMFPYSPEKEKELSRNGTKYVLIPCGKCLYCKNKYKSQWAYRMYLESKYHKSSYFITLTYEYNPTWLSRRDLQLFIKRLRFRFGAGLVYFASGEYGSLNGRPHYHLIVFDLPPLEIEENGNCEIIRSIWKKGNVFVSSDADIGSFNYSAGYTAKKLEDFSSIDRKIRPFCLMSKGIGKKHFEDNKDDIIFTDSVIVSNHKNTRSVKSPRYFDKLLEKENPLALEDIKKNRLLFVADSNFGKLDLNNKQIINVYRSKHSEHLDKMKSKSYKI